MKLPSSLTSLAHRFHRKNGRIDVVRDPYTIWFWLCITSFILLLIVLGGDLYVFYQLQTGRLVTTAAETQAPAPIIDETLLSTTAHSYAARATTLATLRSGAASSTPIVDPSQ